MLKKDNLRLGLALGFAAPLVGMAAFYFIEFFPTYSPKDFITVLGEQPTLITGVATLALFANAILLTLYLNKRKDKTAIGVFIATCICGAASLLLKWFL